MKTWHSLKLPAVIGLILIIAGMYWYGAVEQLARVNVSMNRSDQSAYMAYARNLYESNYTFIGGRNRMPVYPFLQSLFYNQNLTDEAFFDRGKYVNLVLSLGLLAGLALVFRQFFSWLYSLNLLLIVAFTVFIFKAGYFQAELLFYSVNFCLFVLMWRLLQWMSWRLAILTGIVAGLAHLTKASILPGLVIFLVLAGVKWGGGGYVPKPTFFRRRNSYQVYCFASPRTSAGWDILPDDGFSLRQHQQTSVWPLLLQC